MGRTPQICEPRTLGPSRLISELYNNPRIRRRRCQESPNTELSLCGQWGGISCENIPRSRPWPISIVLLWKGKSDCREHKQKLDVIVRTANNVNLEGTPLIQAGAWDSLCQLLRELDIACYDLCNIFGKSVWQHVGVASLLTGVYLPAWRAQAYSRLTSNLILYKLCKDKKLALHILIGLFYWNTGMQAGPNLCEILEKSHLF